MPQKGPHLRGGELYGDRLGRLGRHVLPVAADHGKRWVVARKGEVHRVREDVSERDLLLPSGSDRERPLVLVNPTSNAVFVEVCLVILTHLQENARKKKLETRQEKRVGKIRNGAAQVRDEVGGGGTGLTILSRNQCTHGLAIFLALAPSLL